MTHLTALRNRKRVGGANRYFLPDHIWHIIHRYRRNFVQDVQIVPAVQALRSVQIVIGLIRFQIFQTLRAHTISDGYFASGRWPISTGFECQVTP